MLQTDLRVHCIDKIWVYPKVFAKLMFNLVEKWFIFYLLYHKMACMVIITFSLDMQISKGIIINTWCKLNVKWTKTWFPGEEIRTARLELFSVCVCYDCIIGHIDLLPYTLPGNVTNPTPTHYYNAQPSRPTS